MRAAMAPTVALLLALATSLGAPALAQTPDQDAQRCAEVEDPDTRIGACSAAIRAGGWADDTLAVLLSNRAHGHYAKGELDSVIRDCDEAIRLDPSLPAAYTHRGNARSLQGQSMRAIQDYDEAIRLDPGGVYAFYNRGREYLQIFQYERALTDLDRAIEINPSLADAFELRGLVHHRAGRLDAAFADYEAASRIAKGRPVSLYGRVLILERKGGYLARILRFVADWRLGADTVSFFAKHGVR